MKCEAKLRGDLKRVRAKAIRLAHKWSKLTKMPFRVFVENKNFCFVFIECPCAPPGISLILLEQGKSLKFPTDLGMHTKNYFRSSTRLYYSLLNKGFRSQFLG